MADSPLQSLFGSPEEESEEEKEKKKRELQEKNNPFLHRKSLDPKNGVKALRLSLDNMGDSIEKYYYFFQKFLSRPIETSFGIALADPKKDLLKLKDVFDASVSSSFHGQIGSKTSALQQQISGYLTQIGQLTKTIFPMVRDIRMMDERLEFYKKSFSAIKDDPEARQNEVALKSTWIEVVEQGMQNPNSVYSMATKLGFVTLPDLFFGINPHGKTAEEQQKHLTKVLDEMEKTQSFNFKVRRALEKKLIQYYTWKQKTYAEMQHTWKFRIKNLKQHYNVIRLYVSWLKPYMTALKALQMKGDITSPDLVSAFETSKLELELLGVMKRGKAYNACVLVRFTVVTRPELIYGPGGGRQVQHSGQIDISIEPYLASNEDIGFYKDYTDKEVLKFFSGSEVDMIGTIEDMLKSLGTDVEEYLREAETGERKEKVKEKKVKGSFFEPFTAFAHSFQMFIPERSRKKKPRGAEAHAIEEEKKSLSDFAANMAWVLYDVFKKSHGMMSP